MSRQLLKLGLSLPRSLTTCRLEITKVSLADAKRTGTPAMSPRCCFNEVTSEYAVAWPYLSLR